MEEDETIIVAIAAQDILEAFQGGDWRLAMDRWLVWNPLLEADQLVAVWSYFDSKQRAFLKGDDRKYLDEYHGIQD